MKKVCVLGDGAWGTAFSSLLADNGHQVNLWCYDKEVAQCIEKQHRNLKFLPDIELKKSIISFTNMEEAVKDVDWVFEAVPVQFLRSVLVKLEPFVKENHIICLLSKGMEKDTQMLPNQIAFDVLKNKIKDNQIAAVAGPNFANEIANKRLSGMTLACQNLTLLDELEKLLKNSYIVTEKIDDIIGVQVCSALKNMYAVGLGILEGIGGDVHENTKALAFTKCTYEIEGLLAILDADEKTLRTYAGMGDLVLTCLMSKGRNREIGIKIGKGEKLEQILKTVPYVPEGPNTIAAVHQFFQKKGLVNNFSISQALYKILYQNGDVKVLLDAIAK
ncbi:NAD(P)H-dependent glycerol-3-phosphate dehydrogenase [Candidatus Dependentiae bacterium]|nr:NAD(P)H-dependent glycerol-3-phosphate dehydrogenase [Candidatus Dependentiae bacterium]